MIARIWHGWAPPATADDYQRHYESEVSGHLRGVGGFRGARLLRQDGGREVMFTGDTAVCTTAGEALRGLANPAEDVIVDLARFLQVQEVAHIIDHDHA